LHEAEEAEEGTKKNAEGEAEEDEETVDEEEYDEMELEEVCNPRFYIQTLLIMCSHERQVCNFDSMYTRPIGMAH